MNTQVELREEIARYGLLPDTTPERVRQALREEVAALREQVHTLALQCEQELADGV